MNLSKVYISNARRFGENIEIDFVPGANIILAPNGTGKTTVFEAIEFALTGSIKRLENPPMSLIRDNQPKMEIKLNFDNGKHCEVTYKKNSFPLRTGDHEFLFGGRSAEEVAYLLRLTHLLEQRNGDWIVQKNKSDAGGFLDRLSIGKDLSTISSTKTSAIRAANAKMETLKADAVKSDDALRNFEALLSKKKMVSFDFVLVPFDKLVPLINVIAQFFETSVISSDAALPKMIALTAQLIETASQRISENSTKQVTLSRLNTLIGEYQRLNEVQKIHETSFEQKNAEFKAIEATVNFQYKTLEEVVVKVKSIELEQAQTVLNRENVIKREPLKITLGSLLSELATLKASELNLKKELDDLNTNVQQIADINGKHNIIDKNIISLLQKQSNVESKRDIIKQWNQLLEKLDGIEKNTISDIAAKKTAYTNELKPINSELDILNLDLHTIQSTISSLKSASGKVQEAVAFISANLQEDQGDCPVCGQDYTPNELRDRINSALEYINPVLKSNMEIEAKLQGKINPLKQEVALKKKQLEELDLLLAKAQMDARNIHVTINSDIKNHFLEIDTPANATNFIESELKTIQKDIAAAKEQKNTLPTLPDTEVSQALELRKQELSSNLSSIQKQITELSERGDQLSKEISVLNSLIGATTLEELNSAIENLSNQLSTAQANRKGIEEEHTRSIAITKQLMEQLAELDAQIVESKARLSEIQTEWSEASLPSTPDAQIKDDYTASLVKERKVIEQYKTELNKVNEELARWKSSEDFLKCDEEIKSLRGSTSEDTFLESLKKTALENQNKVTSAAEKRKILDGIYSSVTGEMDQVHKYIDGMNETWSSMLKRVVVNPIFANTSLTSYTKSNKPQADIHIPLHGQQTKVTDVASEAQITDLQLTFLLAMANRYKWSPWRGLLLDDPTQHHDLVHAASVFDLLRDFMVSQKSQIILGTHDSVHANFFKRKCQNDNIPVTVWHLNADGNGVKAELLQ